jgi:hypothetical protein
MPGGWRKLQETSVAVIGLFAEMSTGDLEISKQTWYTSPIAFGEMSYRIMPVFVEVFILRVLASSLFDYVSPWSSVFVRS